MTERFDVVIAGAGPAGAQCARDLAQRDYDVLVLETEPEDEFPRQSNKSTAGTFPSLMGAFGIPDDVVMQFTDTVVLESPNEHFVQNQPGAVLEFADFKRFLVKEGREHGAEYRFGSRVSKPIMENGKIVGVEYSGDEEVYADIVVDATGPAAPLAKHLGVSDLERHNQAIGIEWEMEGIEVDHPGYADLHDAMMLRLDHDLAPGGYSWIFHTGEDTAKVGLCYIQSETYQTRGKEGMSIDGYLEYWLDNDPRFENATKLEGKQHRGSAHIQEPGQLCTDNFMAIGDTVPTIDPLWGEGIHKGMKSARAAAITADRCLTGTVDTSSDAMETYADLWHQDVAPGAKRRLAMTRLLYLADDDRYDRLLSVIAKRRLAMTRLLYLADDDRYDRLLSDLQDADPGTLAAANDGSPRAIAKLLHVGDLSILKRLVTEHYL